MNAFGKRNGLSGSANSRQSFGVARPMKGGAGGGDQFPPVDDGQPEAPPAVETMMSMGPPGGAMDRLNQRQNASGEQGSS